MKKEEILAKSRLEGRDEGMAAAENRGRKMGISVFCVVFIIISLSNMFKGQDNYAPMAMFWAFIAAEALPVYQFTKRSSYLVTVVSGSIASLSFLATFLLRTLW